MRPPESSGTKWALLCTALAACSARPSTEPGWNVRVYQIFMDFE